MLIPSKTTGQSSFRRRSAILAALVTAAMLVPAARAQDAEPPKEKPVPARLQGKIVGANGKSPVAGARVHAYHLSSERTLTAGPTGRNGEFSFDDVVYGYYDLAVETAEGLFVVDQVINVPPAGKAVVQLSIRTFAQGATESQKRRFAGREEQPSGVAAARERLTGRDFWRSPKGVAVIVGVGAAALIGFAGDEDSPFASPSTP